MIGSVDIYVSEKKPNFQFYQIYAAFVSVKIN
jgi:hypothetical protein